MVFKFAVLLELRYRAVEVYWSSKGFAVILPVLSYLLSKDYWLVIGRVKLEPCKL